MDLASLLRPYIENLTARQLGQISTYIEILERWNAKMNLTAIREPEQIVKRHFGESLFLARTLSEAGHFGLAEHQGDRSTTVVDVGSGAGFPGIPLKIACPSITLVLIEAQQRKAVFLKEVLRGLDLDAGVKNVRAEEFARSNGGSADIVTLRAVEKFDVIVPFAARIVKPKGKIALLIGEMQVAGAANVLLNWRFEPLLSVPDSENRVILLANQSG